MPDITGPVNAAEVDFQNSRISNLEYSIQPLSYNFLNSLITVIDLLAPYKADCDLVRIGNYSDGGYVVATEKPGHAKRCINLGVGYEISADLHLLGLGYQILAIDGTVENPLPENQQYFFIKSSIGYSREKSGYESLRTIRRRNNWKGKVDLFLIDIEGFEYEFLEREWKEIMSSRQVVIEFHGLELMGDEIFSNRLVKILKKIRTTHKVIQIHGNNAGPAIPTGGASWPTILEVTFLQNSEVSGDRNFGPFPGVLDAPNTTKRPDINLQPFFSTEPSYALLTRKILESSR